MSTEISVALVYQQAESTAALRTALGNAGVRVAVEARADSIDASGIIDSGVDAIVVNLDPELDDLLDRVTEALDAATQPVIFNDPEASSDLSGWDRARWMRHLSAKLKGGGALTPPLPPDAKGIPSPKRVAAAPAVAAVAPATRAEPPAATPEPTVDLPITREVPIVRPPVASATDVGEVSLDEFLFGPSSAAPSPAPATTLTMGDDLGDLDALFVEPSIAVPDTPAPQTAPDASLFDAPSDLANIVQPTSNELADLDALFADLSTESPAPASAPTPDPTPVTVERKAVEVPIEWSLEPVELPDDVPVSNVGKTIAEWRLDAPAKTLAAEAQAAAKAPPKPAEKTLPPEFEAALDMADLKLLDELPAAASPSSEEFNIDSLDFSADFSLDTPASTASPAPVSDDLGLSDLDFALDFSAEPEAPNTTSAIDDFDGLFETSSPTPVLGLSLPDLNRLFVLGASIGGPESIKAFLAKLSAKTPAAFVIAQHMGAEFLEMMALQLDAATELSVRYPKQGERLKHGEVIVAPAGEELRIDDNGTIRLTPAQSGSPYSPSIDQIVRDAADRFGDQTTLIVFSGMGGDAVEGARYLNQRGGEVWVQDRGSCVISTMIESAKAQGVVRFEGTPAELAGRVESVLS